MVQCSGFMFFRLGLRVQSIRIMEYRFTVSSLVS